VANNRAAVDGVREAMAGAGLKVASVRHDMTGEASELGRWLARAVAGTAGGSCVIVGGEPTVTVGRSPGRGGPSQEVALACAVEMGRLGLRGGAGVVSFSTDGVDGPTDAAGGATSMEDLRRAGAVGLDVERALVEHDSYRLLDRIGGLIRTRPTGTNVNHVAVAWV